ncbi:MAG: phospholipase, partial [Methylomonas sp.]
MQLAEHYARPVFGKLGGFFQRVNDFKDTFNIRWGRIEFDMFHGLSANLKVVIKVYRDAVCETYIVDTDPYDIEWDRHKRATRDFYIQPFSTHFGRINCVKFSFIVHLGEHAIPSRNEYIFMDWHQLQDGQHQHHSMTDEHATPNRHRTHEI